MWRLDGGKTKASIAAKYGVSANTVSTWLKNKVKIITGFESGRNKLKFTQPYIRGRSGEE